MTRAEKETLKKIELLLDSINKQYPGYKELVKQHFIKGIATGLGATIGASLVLAFITYVITELRIIPAFNTLFDQVGIEGLIPD